MSGEEVVLAFAAFAFEVFKYALIQNCPAQVSCGASSRKVELAFVATCLKVSLSFNETRSDPKLPHTAENHRSHPFLYRSEVLRSS